MSVGTVKFFNEEKGFGFITPENGGPDVFVHVSRLRSNEIESLTKDDRVSYSVVEKNGKIQADIIKLLPRSVTREVATSDPRESPLVQMSKARALANGHAPATLQAWDKVLEYIRTGSPEFVFDQTVIGHINRPQKPVFEGDWDTLSAWCKLVGIKPTWVYQGGIGARDWFPHHWSLKIAPTPLPDTRLKNKLISEYGTPPGY